MRYVAPPEGIEHAENSRWLMDHIVYMPIHSGMSDKDMKETIDRTIECYYKLCDYLKSPEVPRPIHEKTQELIERAKLWGS